MDSRLLLALGAGLLFAAQLPAQDAKTEQKRIQGEWELVSLERDGTKASEKVVKSFRRKIDGNKYTVTIQKGGDTQTVTGTFRLDPTKKPKAIDVRTMVNGEEKMVLGIYELKGDTQRICMGPVDGPRPTEFSTDDSSGRTMMVWRRVKK